MYSAHCETLFLFLSPLPSCVSVYVVPMSCQCRAYVVHVSYVCSARVIRVRRGVSYGTCIVRYVYRAVRVSCGTCMCACMRACVCVRAFVYACVCVFFEWLNNNGHFS